jgi:hypothetical protein
LVEGEAVSDRELLELAAKAAGIEVTRSRLEDPLNRDMLVENSVRNGGQRLGPWNPLTDDGDALRLAVALNIWPVRQYNRPTIVVQKGAAYFDELASEPIGDDPLAATRRAIVRAAAEIGRNMP